MALRSAPAIGYVGAKFGGGPRVLVLWLQAEMSFSGAEPPEFPLTVEIKLRDRNGVERVGDLGASSFANVLRPKAFNPPSDITKQVTSAMLRDYAIWSYPPFRELGPVSSSMSGGFWTITSDFGVFPDFVPSPYASLGAAEAYIDSQAAIHPEYIGQLFIIHFLPPGTYYERGVTWRSLVFVNLNAFATDNDKNVNIDFSMTTTAQSGYMALTAISYAGRVDTLNFNATSDNLPGFTAPFIDLYDYTPTGPNLDNPGLGGTIMVHPDNTITGPIPPGSLPEG